MLVDHVIASLSMNSGGPTRSVIELSEALSEKSLTRVRLATQSILGLKQALPSNSAIAVFSEAARNKLEFEFGLRRSSGCWALPQA